MGDFLHRVRKRARLNLEALHETVICISERVSRKVQVLSLHWQASAHQDDLERVQQEAGRRLVDLLDDSERLMADGILDRAQIGEKAQAILSDLTLRTEWLSRDLTRIESLIRELETETLRDELVRVQQDLAIRGATLRRVILEAGTWAIGRPVTQLPLPAAVRIAAVVRGPIVLPSLGSTSLRRGDVLLLVGPVPDVREFAASLAQRERALV